MRTLWKMFHNGNVLLLLLEEWWQLNMQNQSKDCIMRDRSLHQPIYRYSKINLKVHFEMNVNGKQVCDICEWRVLWWLKIKSRHPWVIVVDSCLYSENFQEHLVKCVICKHIKIVLESSMDLQWLHQSPEGCWYLVWGCSCL